MTPAGFWAARLGCSAADLTRSGLTLLRHAEPRGFYALAAGSAVVVAAPESLHAALREHPDPAGLLTREAAARVLPAGAAFVGPACLAYLERAPAPPQPVVRVTSAHDPALAALRAAVRAEEWRHANLEAAEPPLFAWAHEGALASASGFQRLLDSVAHVGVVTDPRARSRGLGRRVVQAAAAHAFGLGLLVQYQTLAANAPALRIAESLGFVPFARTLSARWNA
ncbi:MAG TPA: GNAT family N-acetyltransferase [Myxococcota bacterium]|nr:GNAT family N-acetyltransferase [Myxococcota bacterium]